ncbi:hypothetical protein D1610_06265 [Sphingomonas gilva]|uniref:Sugar transporter n=1 Tax=Sphingomonas gilva TaxID=2305907 RepID=A0A396RNM3_9SPHN|nr:hypothetical protein [Sphingomonas gilva]RHW18094.1 hypothetical protein D1610_06265 [Sphingomonas gilva]
MDDTTVRGTVPAWFWVVAALLTLWGAIGCYFCYMQLTLGPDAMPGATDYDRALFAALPDWYSWVYGLAVGTALLGGIALLARSRLAQALFLASLIAVGVQLGWLFAATDIIAAKGASATVPFPLFIACVAMFSVWFAGHANRRGWLR